jgi:hypothetical protein
MFLIRTLESEMPNGSRTCPAGCGVGAGVDSAWEQNAKRLEASVRELLDAKSVRQNPCLLRYAL